ncbi:MAG: RNA polymerase sigma factor [Phycisphaerales bacterium]
MLQHHDAADRPPLSSCTDEELALRAQAGSAAAFALLVERFETRLFSFILRRVRNHADAEDLTQEAFVRAWGSIRRYKPAWRFSTWLYTIASRAAVNHLRRAQVRRRTSDTDLRQAEPAPAPSAGVEGAETRSEVWRVAQEALTDAQFTALWLRYVEDLSMRDIGRVLGKSTVGVRALLFRARSALIDRLDPPAGDVAPAGARDMVDDRTAAPIERRRAALAASVEGA